MIQELCTLFLPLIRGTKGVSLCPCPFPPALLTRRVNLLHPDHYANFIPCMPFRIVITGAPASGKSEFIERLKAESEFADFVFLEEIARQLLEEDPSYRGRWAEFHHEVYRRQLAQEDALKGRSFITDRGTADAFAFHPETAAHYGTTLEDEHQRYDAVILLGSTAAMGEPYYVKDDVRTESPEEVMALEEATINVWNGHPGFFYIRAEADPEVKYRRLRETLLEIIREPK